MSGKNRCTAEGCANGPEVEDDGLCDLCCEAPADYLADLMEGGRVVTVHACAPCERKATAVVMDVTYELTYHNHAHADAAEAVVAGFLQEGATPAYERVEVSVVVTGDLRNLKASLPILERNSDPLAAGTDSTLHYPEDLEKAVREMRESAETTTDESARSELKYVAGVIEKAVSTYTPKGPGYYTLRTAGEAYPE